MSVPTGVDRRAFLRAAGIAGALAIAAPRSRRGSPGRLPTTPFKSTAATDSRSNIP